MNISTPKQVRNAVESGWEMRVGRSEFKRAIYLRDSSSNKELCIGIVNSEELAHEITRRWNMYEEEPRP